MYYDGANFNAIIGKTDPGRMGFDAVHYNLHKTFSQPHGGGGQGVDLSGLGHLSSFLPTPIASRRDIRKTIQKEWEMVTGTSGKMWARNQLGRFSSGTEMPEQ